MTERLDQALTHALVGEQTESDEDLLAENGLIDWLDSWDKWRWTEAGYTLLRERAHA